VHSAVKTINTNNALRKKKFLCNTCIYWGIVMLWHSVQMKHRHNAPHNVRLYVLDAEDRTSWLNSVTGESSQYNTRLTALCLRLPVWAGTRKVKPIWILLKQETVSGSGISWAVCKSAPCPRQCLSYSLQQNTNNQLCSVYQLWQTGSMPNFKSLLQFSAFRKLDFMQIGVIY